MRATAARIDSGSVMELRAGAIREHGARIAAAMQNLASVQPRIGELDERLRLHVEQRLQRSERELTHRAELIAARDFRRRGWLLATAEGRSIRSAADLVPGQEIELELHDGRSRARVEDVHPDPAGSTT